MARGVDKTKIKKPPRKEDSAPWLRFETPPSTNIIVKKGNPTAGEHFRSRTHCNNGHEFTEANTRQRKDGGRACRACRNEQSKATRERWKLNHPEKLRETRERDNLRRKALRHGVSLEDLKEADPLKKNKLDYLKLNSTQSLASDTLNFAVDRLNEPPPCRKDPAPYMDYDERLPPTAVEAAKMCAGCPFIKECGDLARALKPKVGVWGGTVWVDGKPQN